MTKAEKTKRYIVEKTAPVFNRKGYAGTSLSDLTAATGLTKGSIYGNFAGKDEVALAVFDHNLSGITSGMKAAAEEATTAPDKLRKIAGYYRTSLKSTLAQGGCPILNTVVDADNFHPALKKKVTTGIRAWKKTIEIIVQEGIAKKQVYPSVNAAEFATTFIALIEGAIFLAKGTGDLTVMNTCMLRVEKIIDTELEFRPRLSK